MSKRVFCFTSKNETLGENPARISAEFQKQAILGKDKTQLNAHNSALILTSYLFYVLAVMVIHFYIYLYRKRFNLKR